MRFRSKSFHHYLPKQVKLGCLAVQGVLFGLMALSSGCSKDKPLRLTDTEGRTFRAVCHDGSCTVTSSERPHPSATRPKDAEATFILHHASRLYGVCEVWKQSGGSMTIDPRDCRALTCKTDSDCPPAIGLLVGNCTNGLCIEPSGEISKEDAIMLCLAGTGAPRSTTRQVERYALGNNCGNPCRVPPVCRQP